MFQEFSETMLARMRELEAQDQRDRTDGTPWLKRLRQIPPGVGKFLALLAAAAPEGRCLEVGTSAGYSTLWLAAASRATKRKVTTYEILEEKVELARQTFLAAEVGEVVELVQGDALELLPHCADIGFCFLDAEKQSYERYYELIIPRLVPGGILVADNAISHATALGIWLERVFCDPRVDALVVPIGQGELVCRKC